MRSLSFFPANDAGLEGALKDLLRNGRKRILLAGDGASARRGDLPRSPAGGRITAVDIGKAGALSAALPGGDAIVFRPDVSAPGLAAALLQALDLTEIALAAPETESCFRRRPLYFISIPKSGTHLLMPLLERAGYRRDLSSVPGPGCWGTIDGMHHTHALCRAFFAREGEKDPLGDHPFFLVPSVFIYRHPLDILVSELDYLEKEDSPFRPYLMTQPGRKERFLRLINDPMVIGSLRERMEAYAGWLEFSSVIPVSYEELAGSRAGGSDAEAEQTVWSLQLKLQIPGSPAGILRDLPREKSPTFFRGTIGRHREVLEEVHLQAVAELGGDFFERMGYRPGSSGLPSRVEEFRRRPLGLRPPSPSGLTRPRLLKEAFLGQNVVSAGGRYVVIQAGHDQLDLARPENWNIPGVCRSFGSLDEALAWASANYARTANIEEFHGPLAGGARPALTLGEDPPVLAEEGFLGNNLIVYRGRFHALRQGEILGGSTLLERLAEPTCPRAWTLPELKTRLLAQSFQELDGRLEGLQRDLVAMASEIQPIHESAAVHERRLARAQEELRHLAQALERLSASMDKTRDSP